MHHHPKNQSLRRADQSIGHHTTEKIETLILWAFGKSMIEFEDTLYRKFAMMYGAILTQKEFEDHLMTMEREGLLRRGVYLGNTIWRKCKEHGE